MSEKWKNDGGHGGTDPGAVANGIKEKEYTLEAALYVDNRLKAHGIESGLTRDKDITLEPNARTAAVRASKAPFGLSHHYNAGGGAGAEFIHSIFSDGKFEKMLKEEFEKAGYPVRRIFDRAGKNGKDYYYMHRETGFCRMTIVEYDFVDGPNAQKLKDKKYREGMYECVVRAVCRQEGKSYKPVEQPKPKPQEAPKNGLYKVQVGAFAEKDNADRLAAELKSKGYATFIVQE
jgi:N-acetylmuramoyl-L-alanine amidase